jgi:hypothetical protein
LGIHEQSAVGERIGRHIEDAHDQRALAERERPAVRQREREPAAGIHEETLSNAECCMQNSDNAPVRNDGADGTAIYPVCILNSEF